MKTVKIDEENYNWLKTVGKTINKALTALRQGEITDETRNRIMNLEKRLNRIEKFISDNSGSQF